MESGQCLVISEPTSLRWCYFSDLILLNFCGSLKFYCKFYCYFHFHCVVVVVYFELFCLFFFFQKLVGQYKELLWAVSVRWLKRIMIVSTSTYIIDTPCKLTVKGLMGKVSSFGPDPGQAGHFGCWGGCPLLLWEWTVSWFSPLTVLPSSPRADRPWMLCVLLLRCCMDKGWVLAWGTEELQGEIIYFSFQRPWFH